MGSIDIDVLVDDKDHNNHLITLTTTISLSPTYASNIKVTQKMDWIAPLVADPP